jgi:hypothetical protein
MLIHRVLLFACMFSLSAALKAVVVRLISVQTTYDDLDEATACQTAYALESRLARRVHEHMGDLAGRPVLFDYSSDATAKLTRTQFHTKGAGKNIQRRGRHLQEWLSERMFIKSVNPHNGKVRGDVMLRPPRLLNEGKKTGNLFQAAVEFWKFPRATHTGFILQHGCYDRGCESSLSRVLEGRRNSYYDCENDLWDARGDDERSDAEKRDLYTHVGCALHDMSNGLKHGLGPLCPGDCLKNVWLFTEMLRNAFFSFTPTCLLGFLHTSPLIGLVFQRSRRSTSGSWLAWART